MTAAKKRVPFQQVTIEYRVQGELDGLTLAPDVELDPTSPNYSIDDRDIHVVDVPGNLGIIDPDLIGPAAQGYRCIPWVYIDAENAGALGSNFSVVDNTPNSLGVPVPSIQEFRFATLGLPEFYSDRPTCIPQGSALAVAGYNAAGLKILRLNIVAPQDALEYAGILEACCCSEAGCTNPPDIGDATGPNPAITPGESPYSITGGYVGTEEAPLQYAWVQVTDNMSDPATGGYVPQTSQTFVSPTQVDVTFTADADTPPGEYQLVVFDPFDPSCVQDPETRVEIQVLFWPDGCPVMDNPQAAPITLTLGGGPQNFLISGLSFSIVAVAEINLIHHDTGHVMKVTSFVVNSTTEIEVTADPNTTPPADPLGFYDIQLVPTDPNCPTQLILEAVEVEP